MKALMIILLAAIVYVFAACNDTKPTAYNTDIIVVIDRTDHMAVYPTADVILSPLGLEADPYQGVRVTITYISDLDINPQTEIALPYENKWATNKLKRTARIKEFVTQLQKSLTDAMSGAPCKHSIIYRTIARQTMILASSNARNRYLLIYSDLNENANVSFYNARTIDSIRHSPQSIGRQLQAENALPGLTGMQIWFLYAPASYADNNRYMLLAGFFQHMLEGRGAIVHTGTKFTLE